MSTVDERIVEMRFDNAQFEKGVRESLKTLDKLKLGLDLDSSAKSLNSLERTVNNFTMKNMGDSAVRTAESFSLLYKVSTSFLNKIADSAVDAGIRVAKALSFDNISAGFSKYEQQTKAVQTILNNVEGSTMADAEALIHKLMWYTDETSYSFDSMITNIGKFTSAGIDLDVASKSMIGIANACGLAGVETAQASHAMDGFAKSMAAGYMSYQNWSWIKTAGLDTKIFKEELIDAGLAAGKLTKDNKGVIKTAKGTEVTYANLTETLQEKWLDANVMNTALGKFADYTEEIFKIAEAEGITASEAMDKYRGSVGSLGEKAFKAAQEARTFSDAIASVKDAVSSKFAAGFDILFGNYQESKKTWTYLANYLWDVFAWPLDKMNASLTEWKKGGGFADLFSDDENNLGAFYNYFEEFYKYIDAVDELTDTLWFGSETEKGTSRLAESFLTLTSNIKKASQEFEVSEESVEKFQGALYNVLSVVRSTFTIFAAGGTFLGKTFGLFREGAKEIMPELGEGINNAVDSFADFAASLKKAADEFEYSSETVERVRSIFRGLFTVLRIGKNALTGFWKVARQLFGYVRPLFDVLGKGFDYIEPFIDRGLGKVAELASQFVDWAESVDLLSAALGLAQKGFDGLKWLWEKGAQLFSAILDGLADGIEALTGFDIRTITWDDIVSVLESLGEALGRVVPLLWEGAQAAGAFLGNSVINGYTAVANKLTELGLGIYDVWDGLVSGTAKGRSIFTRIISDAKNGTLSIAAYAKQLNLFGRIADFYNNNKGKWEKVFSGIIENFSIGKSLLAALGLSIIPLNLALSDAASNIGGFFAGITGIGSAIKKFITSARRMNVVKTVIWGLVAALIALTASIGYLTYTASKEGGLEAIKAAKDVIMAIFEEIAVIVAMMFVVAAIAKVPTGASLTGVFGAMAAFAIGLALLVAALPKLDGLKLENVQGGVLALVELIFALAGAIALLDWISPKFKGTSLFGTIAFAASIYILVAALARLKNIQFDFTTLEEMFSELSPLLTIMFAFALLAASAGNMKLRGILAFAAFIAMLKAIVPALEALSNIKNPKGIATILGVVAVIIGIIEAFILLNNALKKAQGISPKATVNKLELFTAFASLVLAFIGISYTLKTLSSIEGNINQVSSLVLMISILIFAMLAVSALVGKYAPTIAKGVGMFVGISGSILLLAMGLALIASLPEDAWASIGKALGILGLLALLATGLALVSSKMKGTGDIGASVLMLAASVAVLAIGLRLLAGLDITAIEGVALGIVAFGFAFMLLASVVGRGAQGAPKAIFALAGSVLMLAAALALLSLIPNPYSLIAPVIALVFVMGAFAAILAQAAKMPDKGMLGPMIAMVVLFGEIAAALYILSDLPIANLATAAGALAGVMFVMAVSFSVFGEAVSHFGKGDFLKAAASIIIMTGAIWVLSKAIEPLAQFEWTSLIGAAGALAIGLVAMAVALSVLSGVGGKVMVVAGALFVIAAAAMVAAIALMGWVDALNIAGGTPTNYTGEWIGGIADAIRGQTDTLVETQNESAERINESNENLDDAISRAGGGGGAGLGHSNMKMRPGMGEGFKNMAYGYAGRALNGGASADMVERAQLASTDGVSVPVPIEVDPVLTDNSQTNMIDTIGGMLMDSSFVEGIKSKYGNEFVTNLISGVASGDMSGVDSSMLTDMLGPMFANSGVDVSQMFAGGYADGISDPTQMQKIEEAATMMEATAVENAQKGVGEAVTAGANFALGYAAGIDRNSGAAADAAAAMASGAAAALNAAQQSRSPSRLTYKSGRWFDEGYANAINEYAYVSHRAASSMAQGTVDALGNGLSRMNGIAKGTVQVAPTVRPVMDLRSVQNGSRSLDMMFARRQAMYANIADQERRNNNDLYRLVDVANSILGAVNSGHALYLDGKRVIGYIDRGLGQL